MTSDYKEFDNINYKSISCEDIPEIFLDKLIAKNHFSKFGKISKFILRPNRLECTVDYEQEDEATAALLNAGIYQGHEFSIKHTENGVAQVRNTEEWVDPDVQSELDAMGNISQRQYRNAMLGPSSVYSGKTQQQTPLRVPKPILKSKAVAKPNQKFIVEPINIDARNNELSLQNVILKNDLENIMRKPALNSAEKCNVLDARDKYLRLITSRTTDIKKAVSTKGTCPDMCPEKERLLRETRDQISNFELNNDGRSINHKLAVKEYSRSSADQEAPLAHELRPEPVLKMTMTYLLHSIMNLCDVEDINIGDWFHFVWDRTRSIRKDITQQELCSVDVVELIEQCARFHIHCAARLIAEDPSVFDQKINTENLTKCLQSLKYMYHDLRIKNIHCPNEPEFRAYIVLLNLNDSSFLWEVKQLPDEIRKSRTIKEAIEFYLAVGNNNFVKFFKMIKRTTYMNSCILMRYFNQVRNSAVRTIVKAYTSARQTTIQMPLNYLTEIMAFESSDDATTFFYHYGIDCDYGKVTLEKNWNYVPDIPLQLERYLRVIESKRSVSVGESICGKPLISQSIFRNHQPHNSFDYNGYLKENAWTADDQNGNFALNNRRSLTPVYDNVFKIPINSPPISPKQQQQQQQHLQLKSIFGLAPQKIDPAPFVEEAESEKNSKTLNSIFRSNKLSPTSTPISIFGSPAPTELISKTSSDSNVTNSKMITDENNSLFKPTKLKEETVNSSENNQSEKFHESIFSKAKSIFSSNKTIGNASYIGNQKNLPSLFNVSGIESCPTFVNDGQILRNQSFVGLNKTILNNEYLKNESIPSGDSLFTQLPSSSTQNSFFQKLDKIQDNSNLQNRKVNLKRKNTLDENEAETNILNKSNSCIENPSYPSKPIFIREKLDEIKILEEERRQNELEDKRKNYENLKVKKAKKLEQCSNHILSQIIEEVQHDLINSIVNECVLSFKKNKIIEQNSKNIFQNLCNELISESLLEIIQIEMKRFSNNQKILRKYFLKWQNSAIKSAKRKHLIQKSRNWALPESIDTVAKRIVHPTQNLNLEMMRRYRLGIPKIFDLPQQDTAKKINIFSILSNELNDGSMEYKIYGRMKSKMYLKFVISLPDDNAEIKGFNSYINSFLDKSIERQKPNDSNKGYMLEANSSFALCIQNISGEPNLKTATKCDHLNGLIFFFTLANLSNTHKRLLNLLNNSKINTNIPVALLLYKTSYDDINDDQQIKDILFLNKLQYLEKISNFQIFYINEHTLYDGLTNSIRFLAKNFSQNNILEMQNCISFLQTTIADEIWKRFHDSSLINPSFQLYCTKPEHVINLYNRTISKLTDLFRENFTRYTEFPRELKEFVPNLIADVPKEIEYFPEDWKSEERSKRFIGFLKKLHLKNIEKKWPLNIQELEIVILNYSKQCTSSLTEQSTQTAGYSAIKALLENLDNSDKPIKDRLQEISWLQIIRPLALEILTQVWKKERNQIPNEVIYRKDKYEEFLKVPWWLKELQFKNFRFNYESDNLNDTTDIGLKSHDEDNDNQENLEVIFNRGYNLIDKANENIEKYHYFSNTSREISKNLDISLYEMDSKKIKTNSNSKRSDINDDLRHYSSPKVKKSKHKDNSNDEVQDVIAKALSVIEKVEWRMDVRDKYDLSKINFKN